MCCDGSICHCLMLLMKLKNSSTQLPPLSHVNMVKGQALFQ